VLVQPLMGEGDSENSTSLGSAVPLCEAGVEGLCSKFARLKRGAKKKKKSDPDASKECANYIGRKVKTTGEKDCVYPPAHRGTTSPPAVGLPAGLHCPEGETPGVTPTGVPACVPEGDPDLQGKEAEEDGW
jgi:hypothetical protein